MKKCLLQRKYHLDKDTKMRIRWKDVFPLLVFNYGAWILKFLAAPLVSRQVYGVFHIISSMSQLFNSVEEIVLASGSPRRHAYFKDLGLCFRVIPADIEEKKIPAETSVAYIERLAREKAESVAQKYPENWIVAADTVVCFEDMVLEKPDNEAAAVEMLLRLSGREHTVRTAVCLLNKAQGVSDICLVSTVVVFWNVTEAMVRAYVQTGEPMDKAGSYGIQGKGAFLVREIHGSYSNVVGLPLFEFIEMLNRYQLLRVHSKIH
jgi:nucleoside triphosphate pyrophosphatase